MHILHMQHMLSVLVVRMPVEDMAKMPAILCSHTL